MDTIFSLPLFVLACIQALLSLLLLLPKPSSLPVASAVRSAALKSPASKAVLATVQIALLILTVTSFVELVKGADRVKGGDVRA